MNAGANSGASTPSRVGTAQSGSGPVGSGSNAKVMLTSEGSNRMGGFREDGGKSLGASIELRDLIFVLERDSTEPKALQQLYASLDKSLIRKS
jgi:hypothetical protein